MSSVQVKSRPRSRRTRPFGKPRRLGSPLSTLKVIFRSRAASLERATRWPNWYSFWPPIGRATPQVLRSGSTVGSPYSCETFPTDGIGGSMIDTVKLADFEIEFGNNLASELGNRTLSCLWAARL